MTSAVTTHVLDAARGRPAAGIAVWLESDSGGRWEPVAEAETDADGRARDLGPERLAAGTYRLTFATGEYFDRHGTEAF